MLKITVTEIHRTARCINMHWKDQNGTHVSNFYYRSNGTWGMDPDLARQSSTVRSLLWILARDPSFPRNAERTAILRYDD